MYIFMYLSSYKLGTCEFEPEENFGRATRDGRLDLPFTICKIWPQGLAKH